MQIPTLDKAHAILLESGKMNPGPWVEHSMNVGKAAQAIAERHLRLDSTTAYIMGSLHDIGRRFGFSHLKHILDGYNFMMELGYADIAKICLTHSFPLKDINAYFGEKDCSQKEIDFIMEYLHNTEYSEYDTLLQLCDALAAADGFCLLEKRMVDVVLRNGVAELTREKWQKTFAIKEEVEQHIHCSVYDLLPGVVENTFKLNMANQVKNRTKDTLL